LFGAVFTSEQDVDLCKKGVKTWAKHMIQKNNHFDSLFMLAI